MLNVRLDKELEEKLEFLSKKEGVSKSKIVKDALIAYLDKGKSSHSAFELGKDLFGIAEGEENLSSTFKEKIKEKLNAKFTH
jgi:predicted DNA-binding protein